MQMRLASNDLRSPALDICVKLSRGVPWGRPLHICRLVVWPATSAWHGRSSAWSDFGAAGGDGLPIMTAGPCVSLY